ILHVRTRPTLARLRSQHCLRRYYGALYIYARRVCTASVLPSQFARSKTRDPQLGASMEETHLTFQSEAIGNITPVALYPSGSGDPRGRASTHIRRYDDERSSQGNPYIDSSDAVSRHPEEDVDQREMGRGRCRQD